jgi:GntR family transcriptional regulator
VSVDVLPDPSSSIPLYAQVERLVRQMIELPPYRSGELLPDEVTLSRNWKVSRNTVRTAMSALVAEGVLQRQSGVGTRVRADRLSSGVAAWHSFTREMAKRGIAVQRLSRETACEVPPSEVAEALGTPSGSKVLRVDQVRGWDDIPSAAFQSYLHPRLGLRASDDFTRPLYDLIAERSGIQPARSVEEFSAVAAADRLADQLAVPVGSPLLLRKRLVLDTAEKPMEVARVWYRSDRFTLSLVLEKERP